MFDPKIVMDNLPVIGGFLVTIGLFYKAWSETRRLNKEAELKNKREDLELSQLAAKFNIETVAGATTSAVSVLTGIADRLKSQVDESDVQIATLKQSRAERDEEIARMKERQSETDVKMGGLVEANRQLAEANQNLTNEVAALRELLLKKDAVIQEQEGRIQKQGQRIQELEGEYQKVQLQVNELTAKLQEAEAKILEESGGGTG